METLLHKDVSASWWKFEYTKLAVYNAEVARGIVHTPEWKARMLTVQKEYNQEDHGRK